MVRDASLTLSDIGADFLGAGGGGSSNLMSSSEGKLNSDDSSSSLLATINSRIRAPWLLSRKSPLMLLLRVPGLTTLPACEDTGV